MTTQASPHAIVPVGTVVNTSIPTRLDRLDWSGWHRRVVIALGITWILDGLEATLIAAAGPVLREAATLNLTESQVGLANSIYLIGEVAGALVFGHLTDALGRKKLFLVTLALYLTSTALSGLSPNLWVFGLFRFFAGAGIGGEYAAINSAIDELIPARLRGRVDLAINGSYWMGVASGAGLTLVLLNPHVLPHSIGWRLIFGLGAILGMSVILVRRDVPESPRWLLMRGRIAESEAVVDFIEGAVRKGGGKVPERDAEGHYRSAGDIPENVRVKITGSVGFGYIAKTLLQKHLRRTVLGLTLMISQAFFYNAIFFSYGLILTRFYHVADDKVGLYLIPFAIGNFCGPLLLGPLFDSIGRRRMIAITYIASGVLLTLTGWMFQRGMLDAKTQTAMWCVVFFFASSAASSAYLTVSELFPVELRGMAIALFFSIATGASAVAPVLFGRLVQSGSRTALFNGYLLGSALMIIAGVVAAFIAENAEGKSLEQLADVPASE